MRVLVAKCDGVLDRHGDAFQPGSITGGYKAFVTKDFQPDHIGIADIVVEGNDVFADIDLYGDPLVDGLFPAVGVTTVRFTIADEPVEAALVRHNVMVVSLCKAENADERIPPISS